MTSTPPESLKAMADRGIPIADLTIISLARLHQGDKAEKALLEDAASTAGFFFLDLSGDTAGDLMLAYLPGLFSVAEEYFTQPEEIKLEGVRLDISDFGWKKGNGAESFEISRDEVATFGDSIPQLPQLFQNEWKDMAEFNAGCDDACMTMLNSLSIDPTEYHRTSEPSDTGLKFVSYPSSARVSDVRDNLHTDNGTLTLLFYKEWSIHAFFRKGGIWAFIPPLENCALVNVANSLQKISGGRLHSPEHRATQPLDGAKDRYFVTYLLRPENAWISKWNATDDHA